MTDAALGPGATLGRFRIVGRLGAGGMGEVYRALDELLKREVALKVLPAETLANPAARARLLREARSAAALSHPHVCMVHEVGEDGGRDFIAMEWVDGRSLDHLVRGGGLPAATVVRVGAEIADALAHAHGRGVVHRDLKSANVMLSSDGRVKVLDFGLARIVSTPDSATLDVRGLSQTEPGAIVGTTHYMAPEVLRGAEADARADIWALGVVLYELACGSMPFEGQTRFEVASAILQSPPRPLPETLPAGLRAVVARCLQKEPALRYQGAGEVRAILETATASGAMTLGAALPPPSGSVIPSTDGRKWPAVPRVGLVVGVLAGLALLVALVANRDRLLQRFSPGAVSAPIRAIAVLPFENQSRDTTQAYFASGVTDAISSQLTKISALHVIAQSSVGGLVQKRTSLAEMGRQLGVPVLVRGSVLIDSLRVHISMQLIRAATGEVLWAENYDRSQRDVLSVQSEVALAVAKEIRVTLKPDEKTRLAAAAPVDPEAYRAYLRGRAELAKGAMKETEQEAERQFRRAIELAPDYAPAWAGIASTAYAMSSLFLPPNIAIPKARAAAEKALALDPNLAEAHTMYGATKMVYDWDWAGAMQEFERAIALQPGDGSAYAWRGGLLSVQGHFDEALASIRRASDLNPLGAGVELGWALLGARRYDEAIKQAQALVTANPDAHDWYVALGLAMLEKGDPPGGIASIEKGVGMYAENDDLWQLAYAYGKAGRKKDAMAVIARLMKRRSEGFVPAMSFANAYAGMGDQEQAFRWLDLAFEDHSEQLINIKIQQQWDPLRSDPRFDRALRRLNLLK